MTQAPGHLAISASAGSGKTFRLSHRYIGLLASGVEPERIVALTFSRKAAGEIFDAIAKRLCLGAADPAAASEIGQHIGLPDTSPAHCAGWLRTLLDRLPALRIGTLDSFTVGIARMFPLELGIPATFDLMDEESAMAAAADREVCRGLFDQRDSDPADRAEFYEAFKEATFGREEKSLAHHLFAFLSTYRKHYRELPQAECWAGPDTLWPRGNPWLTPPADLAQSLLHMRAHIRALDGKLRDRWEDFLDGLEQFGSGGGFEPLSYLFDKLFPAYGDLRRGGAVIKIDRKDFRLEADDAQCTAELISHLIHTELTAAIRRTQGLYRILRLFEARYDARIRRRGLLTFQDVLYLLDPEAEGGSGLRLSRSGGDARLFIDFRLDAQLDHWLLDEFQDTSTLQWKVLENLADEVVMDAEQRRSFFYVGDIKQAIYSWRGGNPRLFTYILQRYGEAFRAERLATSYRSSPAVIEMVNQVFGPLPDSFRPAARKRWEAIWDLHASAPHLAQRSGYAALVEPQPRAGENKPGTEDFHLATAGLLNQIDPLRRGLSAAVLVRSNKDGASLVDCLRRECPGMPVVHEGNARLDDHPVVALLRSLVAYAAHPGDSFARRHLAMSPLAAQIPAAQTLLAQLQRDGLQLFLLRWGTLLDQGEALDAFGRKRLADLLAAAGEFDRDGERDADAFLEFLDGYTLRESSDAAAVRVMTIHQSKGLEFDLVILPELMGRSMDQGLANRPLVATEPDSGLPIWIIRPPRKAIADCDDTLREAREREADEQAFDSLCVLYVALTRAKRGLYMISGYPGDSAKSLTPAAFIKLQTRGEAKPQALRHRALGAQTINIMAETGDERWFEAHAPAAAPAPESVETDLPSSVIERPSLRRRLLRSAPSRMDAAPRPFASLFTRANTDSLRLGTALHALFETFGWAGETDPDACVRSWRAGRFDEEAILDRAEAQFRHALEQPAIREALTKPDAPKADLWRERSFDVVLGDAWFSGTFDRVVIERDARGLPLRATILDYKSNDVRDEAAVREAAEHYRPQLDTYRRALSAMLGLPETQIRTRLIFTQPGLAV